jgi:hypothetical protein
MFKINKYFSVWIFVWFILYYYKYTNFNPLYALILAFIIGYILFIIPMIQNNVSISYLFYFTMITVIVKVIPIYLIRNDEMKSRDILFSLLLYLIYLLHIKYLYCLTFHSVYNNILNKLIDEDKKKTPFFCLFNKI